LKFDATTITNALGIAGSLSCGLLEFARSGTGAMVKRLHLGRAAESGVLAASLAEDGFTGPQSVLEGPFGFLNVYCGENDVAALTRGLGDEWASLRIMLKRFPVHITSHTSVQAVQDLRREHGYDAADVASIHIDGNQKMATVNNIPAPADLMMAQYSLPFCVALAHYKEARDPASFNLKSFNDPAIRGLAKLVTISVADEAKHGHTIASTVSVTLKNGVVLTRRVDSFKGTPELPLSRDEMREKFLLLRWPPRRLNRKQEASRVPSRRATASATRLAEKLGPPLGLLRFIPCWSRRFSRFSEFSPSTRFSSWLL